MAHEGLTRREFFVGGGIALGATLLCGAVGIEQAYADVLRPPGSLAEEEFLQRCIRCERCISVCPTDVLRPMGIEEGVLQVRTPVIDYSLGACTYCDKCREVCPTAAIGSADPLQTESGRIGVAMVRTDKCIACIQAGSCGICIPACPYGALSLDSNGRPVVDVDACNGCGECEAICTANVSTSFGGSVRGIEVVTQRAFENAGE